MDRENDRRARGNFETKVQNNQKISENRRDACDTVKTRMEIAMAKIGYEYNETKKKLISIKNRKIKLPNNVQQPLPDILDEYLVSQILILL